MAKDTRLLIWRVMLRGFESHRSHTHINTAFEVLVITSVAKTATEYAFDGGVLGFDRAKSNRVDSTVGDLRIKEAKL